jgi:hypothetical protein
MRAYRLESDPFQRLSRHQSAPIPTHSCGLVSFNPSDVQSRSNQGSLRGRGGPLCSMEFPRPRTRTQINPAA